MASRRTFSYPRFQAFDGNGDPLSGGSAEFFDAGTTTNRSVYSDPGLTTTAPNPVTLNSRGEPESGGGTPIDIYLDNQPYKIVLKDSDGNTVWTIDDYIVGDLLTGTGNAEVPTNSDIFADTLSDLQGKDTSGYSTTDTLYLRGRVSVGDGGEGHFRWDSSNLSTEVGNDEVTANEGDGGIYVAPDSDKTGASGAWVRQHNPREIYAAWWGVVGDYDFDADTGTDNSSALLALWDYVRDIWNNEDEIVEVIYPGGNIYVSYAGKDWTTGAPTLSANPFNDRADKCFYYFGSTNGWNTGNDNSLYPNRGNADGQRSSNTAHIIMRCHNSIFVCDGPSNSWFIVGDGGRGFPEWRDCVFMAHDGTKNGTDTDDVHCMSLDLMPYGHFYNVAFEDWINGVGFNTFRGERCSAYGMSFAFCKRPLVLGDPTATEYADTSCNEFSFYDTIIMECGATFTESNIVEGQGVVEYIAGFNTRFIGGSIKENKAGVQILCAINLQFKGVYFESIGKSWYNDGTNTLSDDGLLNFVNFNPVQSSITTSGGNTFDENLKIANVTFDDCWLGNGCRILFAAHQSDAEVGGVEFNNCAWNTNVEYHYTVGSEGKVFGIMQRGMVVSDPIDFSASGATGKGDRETAPRIQREVAASDWTLTGTNGFDKLHITFITEQRFQQRAAANVAESNYQMQIGEFKDELDHANNERVIDTPEDVEFRRAGARVGRVDGSVPHWFFGSANGAPGDAALNNGEFSFYRNEANNQLEVKVKYADGTVVTGVVASLS